MNLLPIFVAASGAHDVHIATPQPKPFIPSGGFMKDARTKTVAIVEDDPSVRPALERILTLAGFHVEGFDTAEEYLAAVSRVRADCLVCDVYLPGLSGFALRRELVRAGSMVPVIFITAHDSAEVRAEALAVGAKTYLPKPFEGSALVRATCEATRST